MLKITIKYIHVIAEPKGETTNRDALSFRVCIYVCMYVCMYICMYIRHSQFGTLRLRNCH